MKTFSVLAFLAPCVLAVCAVDYCCMRSCNEKKHIGCNNPKRFGSICGPTVKMMEFDSIAREAVVRMHNEKRNLIASGSVKPFLPASAMKIMAWDNELAKLASLNVLQCQMKHNCYRNTKRCSQYGMNFYSSGTTRAQPSLLAVVENGVNAWYEEHTKTTMSDINKCPSDISKNGNFMVMAAQENNRLGCVLVRFIRNSAYEYLFVCINAVANMIGRPIYLSSVKPASGCKVRDNDFRALCKS